MQKKQEDNIKMIEEQRNKEAAQKEFQKKLEEEKEKQAPTPNIPHTPTEVENQQAR